MTRRHAFLIMAHDDYPLLKRLVSLLDHERADVFVHIDKRSPALSRSELQQHAAKSSITMIPRRAVRWSGYSQVEAELALLQHATAGEYEYYHLLSGHDLPIVHAADLYEYFDRRTGTEFVEVWATSTNGKMTPFFRNRFSVYHLFEPRTRDDIASRVAKRLLTAIQLFLRVDRTKRDVMEVAYGTNWFSITHKLATYVLDNAEFIRDRFRFTSSPDELFLQTLVMNSPFQSSLHQTASQAGTANARFIDWSRPGEHAYSPHVLRAEDYDAIIGSGCCFARKFDTRVDSAIIDRIATDISRPSETR